MNIYNVNIYIVIFVRNKYYKLVKKNNMFE